MRFYKHKTITMTAIPVLVMSLLNTHDPQLAVAAVALIIGIAVIFDEEIGSPPTETSNINWNSVLHLLMKHQLKRKKRLLDRNKKKRRRIVRNWDWERACNVVAQDYTGPNPIFNDRQFEWIFRVSRSIFDQLLTEAGHADPFSMNFTITRLANVPYVQQQSCYMD